MINWMAYELSCSEEFRDKVKLEKELEKQKSYNDEQRSDAIKQMFRNISGVS